MTDTRHISVPRRWMLLAVSAAVILYGAAGFPLTSDMAPRRNHCPDILPNEGE